jgi:hypothetical protein
MGDGQNFRDVPDTYFVRLASKKNTIVNTDLKEAIKFYELKLELIQLGLVEHNS